MSELSVCEEKVFTKVHHEHSGVLRNFLFYKIGDLEKARDLAQEAFIRLWDNCSKVPFDKTKSFLFTVGNRLFLDNVSHQKVVLRFEKQYAGSQYHMGDNPEYVYEESEFKERLEEAISSLSEKQRSVFLLSRIDKMKNREIAETLDISIKTVEKHIATSLTTLKAKLDELTRYKI